MNVRNKKKTNTATMIQLKLSKKKLTVQKIMLIARNLNIEQLLYTYRKNPDEFNIKFSTLRSGRWFR